MIYLFLLKSHIKSWVLLERKPSTNGDMITDENVTCSCVSMLIKMIHMSTMWVNKCGKVRIPPWILGYLNIINNMIVDPWAIFSSYTHADPSLRHDQNFKLEKWEESKITPYLLCTVVKFISLVYKAFLAISLSTKKKKQSTQQKKKKTKYSLLILKKILFTDAISFLIIH